MFNFICFSDTVKRIPFFSTEEIPVPKDNDKSEHYESAQSNVAQKPLQDAVDTAQIPDHEVVILDPWWGSDFMGVAVGFLVTVILILIAVIMFIMYKNHVNAPYEDPATYYQTFIPKAVHPDVQWEGRRFPASPRRLPPTPTTSEEHYTDSSIEYSSPLLTDSIRHHQQQLQLQLQQQLQQQQQQLQQQQQHQAVNWESFFPSPPPGTPPVSHYAATDLLYGRGQGEVEEDEGGKPGRQYFL